MAIRILCVLGNAQGDVRTPELMQSACGYLRKKGMDVDLWSVTQRPLLPTHVGDLDAAIGMAAPDAESALARFLALARRADAFLLASTVRDGRRTAVLDDAMRILGSDHFERRPFALILCGEGTTAALPELRRAAVSFGGVSIDSHYHEELQKSVIEQAPAAREFALPWTADRLTPLVEELLLFASSLRPLRIGTRRYVNEFSYPLMLLGAAAMAAQEVAGAGEFGETSQGLDADVRGHSHWRPKLAKLLALLIKTAESMLSSIGLI